MSKGAVNRTKPWLIVALVAVWVGLIVDNCFAFLSVRSSTWVGLLVDGASVLIATIATLLALRTMRRYTRFLQLQAEELDAFSSRVAHDVLGPLGTIGLGVEIERRRHPDDEQTQRIVNRTMASLRRVRTIVEGLLDFARAGAQPHGEICDVHKLLEGDLIPDWKEQAALAETEMSVEPFGPCLAACSAGALTSILSNLVRNAIKYMGESSTRRLTVRVIRSTERLTFEVEDTGPGIPAHLQNYIFEPYARVPGTAQPGLGIGLATVRRLVVAHGGRVGVRSEVGHGAVFWFELLRVDEHADAHHDPDPAQPAI